MNFVCIDGPVETDDFTCLRGLYLGTADVVLRIHPCASMSNLLTVIKSV